MRSVPGASFISLISCRQVSSGDSPGTHRTSGIVPLVALGVPSGCIPVSVVNRKSKPVLSSRVVIGDLPKMPSPPVLWPTTVAQPVALQKLVNMFAGVDYEIDLSQPKGQRVTGLSYWICG